MDLALMLLHNQFSFSTNFHYGGQEFLQTQTSLGRLWKRTGASDFTLSSNMKNYFNELWPHQKKWVDWHSMQWFHACFLLTTYLFLGVNSFSSDIIPVKLARKIVTSLRIGCVSVSCTCPYLNASFNLQFHVNHFLACFSVIEMVRTLQRNKISRIYVKRVKDLFKELVLAIMITDK